MSFPELQVLPDPPRPGLRRCGHAQAQSTGLEDFMPLSWRPRMDETWGCAAR